MGAALDHTYRYLHASALDAAPEGPRLRLATSGGAAENPLLFRGRLLRPKRTAELLRALMSVVGARYHVPPAMLARILREADPVVTAHDDRLRFEGFSACCSAYARVDLLPEAVDGEWLDRGTTNVDFNPPMLAALARVRDADAVTLGVGVDRVELQRAGGERVVEKKVALPVRWLKGLVEVAAYQRRLAPAHEVSGAEARRFLRALPRGAGASRRPSWVVAAGRGLRLSQREAKGGVRVGGLARLSVLERIATHARWLRVYGHEGGDASAWMLGLDEARFTLVLSADTWRGFSGEGQALAALAAGGGGDEAALARVRAALRWEPVIDPGALAARAGCEAPAIDAALAALGTRGLVGFDLEAGAWFHRELPFDLGMVEKLQPRLKAARELVARGAVKVVGAGERDDPVEATVAGSGVEHRVRLGADGARCTCPWFAKHQGARGPCKHVLATQVVIGGEEGDGGDGD